MSDLLKFNPGRHLSIEWLQLKPIIDEGRIRVSRAGQHIDVTVINIEKCSFAQFLWKTSRLRHVALFVDRYTAFVELKGG